MTDSGYTYNPKEVSCPAQAGFYMPAEWAPHEATWLAWPKNKETWPGDHLQKVEEIYLQMIDNLLPHEKVHLLVENDDVGDKVFDLVKQRGHSLDNLLLYPTTYVDSWIRDYGPTFLIDEKGGKARCKWIFNAWGEKYQDLMPDNEVFKTHDKLMDAGFVLEGGSIEVNGKGTLLVTEQCLLNKNRNPHLSKEQIEQNLKNYLGVTNIIWLGDGIVGDDTDGHIDDITRFVDEKTIVSCYEEDESDENHKPLKENWERLERAVDQDGNPFRLIKLALPGKVMADHGRLPASYANFYIANYVVLVPIYGHANDEVAIQILKEAFPTRKIVPINCYSLVYGMGSIHCVTQQEPA